MQPLPVDILQPHIAIDEAGRGCLAGPVVAAAVFFAPGYDCAQLVPGVDDSKKLSEKKRLILAADIKKVAIAYGLGLVWPRDIDAINILQATFVAMSRAVYALYRRIRLIEGARLVSGYSNNEMVQHKSIPLYIDGNMVIRQNAWNSCQNVPLPAQYAIVDGDARVASIAAASILAKTHRDLLMTRLDARYPQYAFARHKGYGTREHIRALEQWGASPVHRHSFRKVKPEPQWGTLPLS